MIPHFARRGDGASYPTEHLTPLSPKLRMMKPTLEVELAQEQTTGGYAVEALHRSYFRHARTPFVWQERTEMPSLWRGSDSISCAASMSPVRLSGTSPPGTSSLPLTLTSKFSWRWYPRSPSTQDDSILSFVHATGLPVIYSSCWLVKIYVMGSYDLCNRRALKSK